jgi:hypothetical protein
MPEYDATMRIEPAIASVAAPTLFVADARVVIGAIRETFLGIIEFVCGGSPRAQDITDRFALHRKLGWQIWHVAYAEDSLLAVRFMPSEKGLELWRRAGQERGVPAELLEKLRGVRALFDDLVRRHAKDRALLELMVESSEAVPDEASEQRWRKQAFSGNSYIWGVRASTLLATAFLHPSQRRDFFDLVRIQGLIGLMRTRANVRWPFAQSIVQSGAGPDHAPRREPLVRSTTFLRTGVPVLDDLCSQPTPVVQRRMGESDMLEDELLPGPVGQTGECTLLTGEIIREVGPVHATHPGETALFGTGVRTPAELLISDHFVHRDLFKGVQRELCVFSELISPTSRDERDRVPVSERIQSLGRGTGRIRTAELPGYGELVDLVMRQTGWNADEFDVFRIRMRYPPIPVSVMVRHSLPPPGEA